jgi:hypothetical protein
MQMIISYYAATEEVAVPLRKSFDSLRQKFESLDPQSQNKDGLTPLDFPKMKGDITIVMELIGTTEDQTKMDELVSKIRGLSNENNSIVNSIEVSVIKQDGGKDDQLPQRKLVATDKSLIRVGRMSFNLQN